MLTRGSPSTVSLLLRRAGAPQVPSSGARSLQDTYWAVTELAGEPVTAPNPARAVHIVFQQGGQLVGSDGCNSVTGSYELTGEAIKFGQMAGTLMACADTATTERAFRDALKNAASWRIVGDRLELFDASGKLLARFEARDKK